MDWCEWIGGEVDHLGHNLRDFCPHQLPSVGGKKFFWTQQQDIPLGDGPNGPNCFLSLSFWTGYSAQWMELPRRHRNQPLFTILQLSCHSFGLPLDRPDKEDACTIAGKFIWYLHCDAVLIGSLSRLYLQRIWLLLVRLLIMPFHSVRRQGHHGRPQSLNNPPTTSLDPTGCGSMGGYSDYAWIWLAWADFGSQNQVRIVENVLFGWNFVYITWTHSNLSFSDCYWYMERSCNGRPWSISPATSSSAIACICMDFGWKSRRW